MVQIVVEVRDDRLLFFLKLLHSLNFVEKVYIADPLFEQIGEDDNSPEAWHQLSEATLMRLWDNAQDAVYDNWRDLYL